MATLERDVELVKSKLLAPGRHGGHPPTRPPTVACKHGSSVGTPHTHCTHVFLHVWRPICMLSRCLAAKSLHRSSGGSLSRVRCWLGTVSSSKKKNYSVSRSIFLGGWVGGGGESLGYSGLHLYRHEIKTFLKSSSGIVHNSDTFQNTITSFYCV